MKTVDDVFQAFGGAQEVAKLLGVTTQAASNMKMRGAIPSRHWARLVDVAKKRSLAGVSFEVLASIRSKRAAA